MLGRTHQAAALGAVISSAILFPQNNITPETIVVSLLVAMLGGISPDIDKPGSKVWDKIPAGGILSRLINPIFIGGHRHLTHSILGIVIFGLIFKYVLSILPLDSGFDQNLILKSYIIAFCSHLILDMFTKDGIPILFPLPLHFGFPPVESLRLKTNGFVENFVVLPAIIFVVVFIAYKNQDNLDSLLKTLGIS